MGLFHRVGQYISAVQAEIFGVDGDDWIARYLSEGEKELWKKQKAPDRAHSLNVAKTAERLQNNMPGRLSAEERIILQKAALLHDIGRGEFGSSLAKSLAVLLTLGRTSPPQLIEDNKKPDAQGRPGASEEISAGSYSADLLYHYYCHPEIGAELLRDLYSGNGQQPDEAQERVIGLVRHHRDRTAGDDRLLKLLIEADRQN